jgi:undecaprenyl pyrophosphate phosphatase UppP
MLGNLSTLTTQLATIAAVVKVLVDLLKVYIPALNPAVGTTPSQKSTDLKFVLSIVVAVIVALCSNISLVTTSNHWVFYLGSIGAGLVAGLGANVIHEVVSVLQTIKTLKK